MVALVIWLEIPPRSFLQPFWAARSIKPNYTYESENEARSTKFEWIYSIFILHYLPQSIRDTTKECKHHATISKHIKIVSSLKRL